jgi:murein DD-endopeptidase MepM/ murein hydrolase activator NlpD
LDSDRRQISIIVIPHSGGRIIEKRFSSLGLKITLGLIGLGALAVIVMVVWAARIHVVKADYQALQHRNGELERALSQLAQLKIELARMKEEDERIRSMLGFDQQPPKLDLERLYQALAPDSTPESLSALGPDSIVPRPAKGRNPLIPSIPPLASFTVSRGWARNHPGMDLVAETGAPVWATADGKVRFAGWDTIYGNAMEIQHRQGFVTFYGHLLRITHVTGDSVRQGQVIGYLGSTGRSTSPHLHYEVRRGKRSEEPRKYLQ